MTGTEDRLRDAFSGAAETIRPGSLAPLSPPPPRARSMKWAVPVAVAGALTLVLIGTSMLVGGMSQAPRTGSSALSGAPERIVAIRGGHAMVEDAAGHPIVRIDGDRYEAVAATRDRRTFFLAASAASDTYSFYRVTLGPDGSPTRPQRVPATIRLDSGLGKPERFAASPDGSKLAVVGNNPGQVEAVVIDVRTGASRVWRASGDNPISSATWSPDNRTLGFIWSFRDDQPSLYLLDTGAARLAPRVLRSATTPGDGLINVFAFNPDGRTLTAQVQGAKRGPDDDAEYQLVQLSARTGQPTPWTARLPSDSFFVKPDASGNHFLQIIDGRLGRVDNGVFTWTTTATDYTDAAW
ncbi:TolB family protein [Actinomadura gamaensis]|uniref:TolB family protein n=1 Tax=Actinomadura gamaensis TaxID=1763541 RepID=A0ABV9U9M6_9ACTN